MELRLQGICKRSHSFPRQHRAGEHCPRAANDIPQIRIGSNLPAKASLKSPLELLLHLIPEWEIARLREWKVSIIPFPPKKNEIDAALSQVFF
jgi:hypothetical protein